MPLLESGFAGIGYKGFNLLFVVAARPTDEKRQDGPPNKTGQPSVSHLSMGHWVSR
jgi:hypothetical protein